MAGSEREAAHLALDAARVSSSTAGDDSLLQNLIKHALMKRFALQRGE